MEIDSKVCAGFGNPIAFSQTSSFSNIRSHFPLYLELRNGHANIERSPECLGTPGPVLGPFIGVRFWREEIRLITTGLEVALLRVADWVIHDNMYFAEVEIISVDQVRFVGNRARVSDTANVVSFAPRANSEWRDAYTQLRGMGALLEDSDNNTWAPGAAIQDLMTEGWPDGRAGFVLNALEGMVIQRSIALLPTDVQAWVKGHAA